MKLYVWLMLKKIIYVQVNWTFIILCYSQKSNLIGCEDKPIISDYVFINFESWTRYGSYKPILFNQVSGKSHSQVLVHDVVIKKITYEDKEGKGEIVNIYKKQQ